MKMKMCFEGMVRISVAKCLVVASMLAGPVLAAAQTTATEADEGPTKVFPRVSGTVVFIRSKAPLHTRPVAITAWCST